MKTRPLALGLKRAAGLSTKAAFVAAKAAQAVGSQCNEPVADASAAPVPEQSADTQDKTVAPSIQNPTL